MSAHLPSAIHQTEIRDGVLLAGSDPHWTEYQPTSTATCALIKMARELADEGTLRAVALVGDLPDFAQISRFGPLGWERPGSVYSPSGVASRGSKWRPCPGVEQPEGYRMTFGDRPTGARVIRYGFNRPPPRPVPQLTPEQVEQLGIEVEPVEPEPEEQQSDEQFLRDLRADVSLERQEPG